MMRMMKTATRPMTPAFTLVELLVAVSCIGLLMALALPAFSRVAAASRSARCTSNLRQMITAAFAYSAVNEERLPPAILYFQKSGGVEVAAWDFVQSPGAEPSPGALWLFTDSPERVQQCPEFHGASTFGNDPHTGYNYNTTFLGAEGTFPQPGPNGTVLDGWHTARLGLPATSLRRTSETAVFGDGGWKGGANKFMRAPMNTVENDLALVYAGGQAFRHGGACNCAYLDGHCGAALVPREGALATPGLLQGIMAHPRNGFLSDDDRAYDPR